MFPDRAIVSVLQQGVGRSFSKQAFISQRVVSETASDAVKRLIRQPFLFLLAAAPAAFLVCLTVAFVALLLSVRSRNRHLLQNVS
jgi:hypothetical protein